MPSQRLHDELNELVGLDREKARRIQKLMDSTARAHGPAHRHDEVHSLPGVAAELLRRGEFTPENLQAAAAHLAQDAMFDALGRAVPAGPARRAFKGLAEDALTRALRGSRRRR